MKVNVDISSEHKETYAIIYTNKMTEEIQRVESSFSGTLLLKLKNGCKENVSRTYLPEFKKYLGL